MKTYLALRADVQPQTELLQAHANTCHMIDRGSVGVLPSLPPSFFYFTSVPTGSGDIVQERFLCLHIDTFAQQHCERVPEDHNFCLQLPRDGWKLLARAYMRSGSCRLVWAWHKRITTATARRQLIQT